MIILGIESTAHTFGIGIVKNGKILANVKRSYTTQKGGIIPVEAAKYHLNNKYEIYFEALDKAELKEEDIDAIAFSQGPGLSPCLIEGIKFSKELFKKLKKPLIPINHCIAHLEIGRITGAKDPVMLYASGANTQIIAYEAKKYRIFGETLDIGIGNFIDNFARYAGIGFPGGPKIAELAEKSNTKNFSTKNFDAMKSKKKQDFLGNYIEIPYKVKGMDIALSGILTNLKQKLDSKKYKLEDLSYSLQETAFAMLIETAERALAHTGKKELLLGGGVACNKKLQKMCKTMCKERKAKFFCPPNELLVDNGAMIAFLGEIMFRSGISFKGKKAQNLDIKPRQRTDDVKVSWK
jgi:N6-L-threonylcarbamoyladenine synthase